MIASFIEPRARNLLRGRKGWHRKLDEAVQQFGKEMIWFHCASLGEFEQGRPVIEKLKQIKPQARILLTFYSPSGYEVRKNYQPADIVLYLPSDTPRNAEKFIRTADPEMAVFIKYEFWFNFIYYARQQGIPVISVSSIFRNDQIFFKPWGKFFRNMLYNFSAFFVQDEASRALLEKTGVKEVTVSGDTRFDRVHDICSHPVDIEMASRFSKDSCVVVLGSTWPSDMKIFYSLINDHKTSLKFMIAPHNISDSQLREIESNLKVPNTRYSKGEFSDDTRVLIIDNVGMLYSLYRYGKIAYVGGAFRGGLHNILEPAAYGIPVIFGNHVSNKKFRETSAMVKTGGGFSVRDETELKSIISRLTSEDDFYEASAKASAEYIRSNTGATAKIVDYILPLLKS